jgi:hypothetical protein
MWPFTHKSTEGELAIAQDYVERNRYSGLTRHYDVKAVQQCISDTGVQVTKKEATDIVNTVRQQNGWDKASHL